MEETLAAPSVTAAMPSAAASVANESSQSKEEGELSSDVAGDAVECQEADSALHSADCDIAQVEEVETVAVDKINEDSKAENFAGKSTYVTDASSKACQQINHHKNSEKTRVPFVISFSDDDSGSDSDNSRRDTFCIREQTQIADRIQKSQKSEEAKVMSAKASVSRPFVSAVNKVKGTNSRKGGQIRSYKNTINIKKGAERVHSRKFNVHVNTRKQQLQDLRQLIAFRESQLKTKPSQQANGAVRANPGSPLKRLCGETSVDELQSYVTESEKKRPKTGEFLSNQLALDHHGNTHSVDHTLASGKLACQTNNKDTFEKYVNACQTNNKDTFEKYVNSCKVVSQRTSRAGLVVPQHHDKIQCSLPSANPHAIANQGAHVALDSRRSDSSPKLVLSPENADLRGKRAADIMSVMEIDGINAQDMQMSAQNRYVSGTYLKTSDQNQVKPSERVINVYSADRAQDSVPRGLQTGSQETMKSSSFLSGLDKLSMGKCKDGDVKSLLDLEVSLDKELEEAQEHRHKCEIEERNALTAYRKAQRALIEASARCSQLYNKRELFSAQLRSLMMDNPNLFFTTSDDIGVPLNSNTISDFTGHAIPSRDVQASLDDNKQGCHEFASLDNASQNHSDRHLDRQNFGSAQFGQYGGSSSQAHKEYDVFNGVCHPSIGLSQPDDEDEELLYLQTVENLCRKASDLNGGTDRDINDGSKRQLSSDGPQDSFLLEASLRSQLFEKLKMKKLAKRESQTVEVALELRNENDDGGMDLGADTENALSHHSTNDEQSNPTDVYKEEGRSTLPIPTRSHVNISHSENATSPGTDRMYISEPLEGQEIKNPASVLCPTIRSVFSHMKVFQSLGVQPLPPPRSDANVPDGDVDCAEQGVHDGSNKMWNVFISSEKASQCLLVKQPGFYSCNFAIDASQPLCMYELRGKCNNDECSWQHIRDYSRDHGEDDVTENTDFQVPKKSQIEAYTNEVLPKSLSHLLLVPPTYIVGSEVLKHDSRLHACTTAQGYGNCWQKSFSSFLVLSSLCPTDMLSSEPFLHGTEARIEVHGGWNPQSYFRSRNVKEGQDDWFYEDAAQSLEMALLNFNQEANRSKQRYEALSILSRAIETNQGSAVLWIVYLLIYYSNQKSIGKDDLFQYAVENNKESYELWIMFIHSRVKLDDRSDAYEDALSTLSCSMSPSNGDVFHASQCVLDILLQMMNNLCMSGNVGKAIEKISGLFSAKSSDDCLQMSIRDVITHLEFCDKVVFWVCCLYLFVYKKLPDPIVHSFECWKVPVALDWPDALLTLEEKFEASSVMEMAVDSLALYVDRESLENEETLRAAHIFAVNHVRCVLILEGLDCTRKLLDKYTELYPSCLELVLMSARSQYNLTGMSFDGFEDALRNWPVEVPGEQCLWNQYFECALQSENIDFVKELMNRWTCSVLQDQVSESWPSKDDDGTHDLLQLASVSDLYTTFSGYNQTDKVFGMLNLSIFKRLQNDYHGSKSALECALKAASADNYLHCLRELTLFMLTDSSCHNWQDKVNTILEDLNVFLTDNRALSTYEPLSRFFIQKIEKSIARQLVSKLLSPVSANFRLMNMILDVWSGLLLLPQIQDRVMDLVDFVEAVMEVLPSNYLLAMSVCKLLQKSLESGKASPSTCFWASSLLVNALFHAVPIAPEYCWVEAIDVLNNLACFDAMWESFHKKALSVYPFSVKLWRSYISFCESAGCGESVKVEAQERGILVG